MAQQFRRPESDVPERPISFNAAEDLGAFELAELWADRSAWPLRDRAMYDELAELACLSALARWWGCAENRDLAVQVITYEHDSQELEVRLAGAHASDPVVISRDWTGKRRQVAYDQWMKIDGPEGITKVMDVATLLLRISFQ